MANSADPDQNAPAYAILLETLVCKILGHLSYCEYSEGYSFAVNTINIFIECNENISIFTIVKHK